jgi:hypothetical protein
MVAAGLLVVTTALALLVARIYHLGLAATLVAILGCGGLPGLYLAWAAYRDTRDEISKTTLNEIADQLALAIGAQWDAEVRGRRVNDPYPLPVSWSGADPALTDDWGSLEELARSGAGWPAARPSFNLAVGREELAGQGRELPNVLARVPTGRLVVLGEPGAGKTILMIRLVLDLLDIRARNDPVPFLVPLASWRPGEQELSGWLAARLTVDHPALKAPAPPDSGTGSCAEALVREGLILPVLDGLDEISESIRGLAIARINDAMQPRRPIVITCRTEDYENAVRPQGGMEIVLRGAAAIQLQPLTASVVADWLLRDAGGPEAKARWTPVLSLLATKRPVAQTLTTPLMVGLARVIYNPRPGELAAELRDPVELCDPALIDRAAVEAVLVEAFIPAAYRRKGRWTATEAEPWLVYLAHHLEHTIVSPDLAWWQLPKNLRRATQNEKKPQEEPAVPSRKLRFLPRRLALTILASILLAIFLGGMSLWEQHGKGVKVTPALTAATIIVAVLLSLVIAIPIGISVALEGVPDNLAEAASPKAVLENDRKVVVIMVLAAAPATALIFGLIGGVESGIGTGIVDGLLVAPIPGLMASWYEMAWTPYTVARVRLAVSGRLPWSLMSFLDDAHNRGVLRQAGAVYQFRHIKLQRWLADRYEEPRRKLMADKAGVGTESN